MYVLGTGDQAERAAEQHSPTYSPMSESGNPVQEPLTPNDYFGTMQESIYYPLNSVTSDQTPTAAPSTSDTSQATETTPTTAEQPPPDITSTAQQSAVNTVYIDGIPVPEGIDPSFLEALPDSIRMEVLLEQSAALERHRRVAVSQQRSAVETLPSAAGMLKH